MSSTMLTHIGVARLLGFSSRAVHTPRNEAVHNNQLLRPELNWPLSADPMVWPTVTTSDQDTPPELWHSLGDLRDAVNTGRGTIPPDQTHWTIAMVRMSPDDEFGKWSHNEGCTQLVAPSNIHKSWDFLGYDVTDESLLSGLTNCLSSACQGFAKWQTRWADKLNDYHLFFDLEDATSYAGAIMRVLRSNRAFSPVGLWKVA